MQTLSNNLDAFRTLEVGTLQTAPEGPRAPPHTHTSEIKSISLNTFLQGDAEKILTVRDDHMCFT